MKPVVSVNDAEVTPPLVSWQELVDHRDFLVLLVWREIHLRYRYTLIGVGWTFLNPLLTMAVLGLIVPNLVSQQTLTTSTGGVPYPLYLYCGLVPWTCFSHALTRANTSLVEQSALLKNMYFPRLMLPFAKVLAALAELLIAFLTLFILMSIFRVPPSPRIVALPVFLILLMATSLGVGLVLAMAQVRYRDVLFVAQYALQLGLLVTPVWFSLNALPESIRWIVALNPMAAVVQGFRAAVLGVDAPSAPIVAVSFVVALVFVLAGLFFFRRTQETVADYV